MRKMQRDIHRNDNFRYYYFGWNDAHWRIRMDVVDGWVGSGALLFLLLCCIFYTLDREREVLFMEALLELLVLD